MSKLIVVSNRVAAPQEQGVGSTGGLAMALSAALRNRSGVWFGWSGETTEAFTGQATSKRIGGVTVALLDLEEQDRQEYYNGYANRVLWPLFHYRSDLIAYERSFEEGYERVNGRFADALLPLIEQDDLIWVQDYHLLSLARELRKRGAKNRIGFFLHVPWPGRRQLTTFPRHATLVEGMLDYDLIGFQTRDSQQAFAEYIVHQADGDISIDGIVDAFGKRTRIGAFPIGIDAADFARSVRSPMARAAYKRTRASLLRRKMIVGVDRLDYSKGLEERFLAYEQLFVDYPEYLEKVFFLQIATPSRDDVDAYQEIRARLDAQTGRINGAYADIDWVPIRYVNKAYRRDVLAGIYRAAHVGLVTPLRDGMNLVAKEYVAAQDPRDPGVLVLSELAGAAEQLKDALIVNPFSREGMAEAMRQALAMPLRERLARWNALYEGIARDDVLNWRDSFLKALAEGDQRAASPESPQRTSGADNLVSDHVGRYQ